jgi:hypothetical protein
MPNTSSELSLVSTAASQSQSAFDNNTTSSTQQATSVDVVFQPTDSTPNVALIAGVVGGVGGFILLAGLIGGIFLCRRKRETKPQTATQTSTPSSSSGASVYCELPLSSRPTQSDYDVGRIEHE